MSLSSHIDEQARRADPRPTDAQKAAGNYKKGHVRVHGLDISIENPRGSWRSGGAGPNKWRSQLPHHYGYIRKTEGGDGDHVDVYLGPHLKSPHVFVVDQHHLTAGKPFDEHKCFIGFGSEAQARAAYHKGFSDGRGKERIGHIETMTVPEFKAWLRDGDTTTAVKRRAAGGSVRMADGGVPDFDPNVPATPVAAPPDFDPNVPATPIAPPQPTAGGPSTLQSAVRGLGKGLSFGFSDEMRAIDEAGGAQPGEPGSVLNTAKGLYSYLTGDKDAAKTYDESVARERAKDATYKGAHPYAYGAGEIAGSIPAMAVLPEGEFAQAGNLARNVYKGAQVGSEYGALSGAGEGTDANSRLTGAGVGAASGVVGGAAAPVGGAVAGAIYDRLGKPLLSVVRGLQDPESEASRRLASALQSDQQDIAAGKAAGMSPTDWVKARAAGEPVTLADLGAGNTQSLLRSAANTSPEGRAILEKTILDRFAGQSERVADDVRGLVAGGANAGKTADQLVAEYDRARAPAYRQAYREGDKEITSPVIERLMGSPLFENAMKGAVTSGKDRAVTEGYGAFNPGVTVENGLLKFTKTKPNGVPTYPNLQYWDAVKKELDGAASVAARSGDNGKAEVAGNLAKSLRGELDKAVPSYADARGVASQFFGESNALEAGRALAGKRVDPETIAQTMRQMKPDERDLFREGYASDWADRVIGNISDSRDITKAMFNSPNERARALAIFGPAGMAKIQTRMTLETIMDGARKAMGNSTTARQLIEAGLAGGALGGYIEGDWKGALTGAGAGVGARKLLASEVASGARKLIGHVDATTAKYVADMLTSSDPNRLAQGLRMATKNQKIADGLRSIANRVALAGQARVPVGPALGAPARINIDTTGWGAAQGPAPGNAQEKNEQPPWVRNQ